jgi:D-alanine--poly(phosphoribitol) ligase subunit 2
MTVADKVLGTLAEVTEVDELRTNLNIRLYDSHMLDSMKTVELMLALSDRFGLDISPAEFDREQWATPLNIIQYIEQRMTQ